MFKNLISTRSLVATCLRHGKTQIMLQPRIQSALPLALLQSKLQTYKFYSSKSTDDLQQPQEPNQMEPELEPESQPESEIRSELSISKSTYQKDNANQKNTFFQERERNWWEKREDSLKKRYEAWNPTRKLSRQAMDDIRSLARQMPHLKTVDLANHFRISPEAIRRILKSNWVPNEDEHLSIMQRAERRKVQRKEMRKQAEQVEKEEKSEKTARTKNYVKSVDLSNVYVKGQKYNPHSPKVLPPSYATRKNGKVSNSIRHNRNSSKPKQKQPQSRKPFTTSVADILD